METTELDSRSDMILTIYAGWDTGEHELKWIAVSRPVEEEVLPEWNFTVDKAVYVPAGNGMGPHVDYSYELNADPECYPFTVYAFIEDETGYNASNIL